ncbi:hypothetical protein CIHG_04831 [Coccidioides immitis H538.4]|uniref:Uncharacterized protein n=3 Tax=Coccidioides immitis TaxID=5501 RepID=A0A0J8QPF4_COCIT|nr:hypothetical protein CIRG_05343 [Coccidioides immitis RMSCC 2394]KMU74394.1 hypothetical protein CISG_04467 [Coccidioides immitis RMSCC 3703]KMU86892.1 hypothetical protein CIHG_04831 [Coccidioides immitis H538.4]
MALNDPTFLGWLNISRLPVMSTTAGVITAPNGVFQKRSVKPPAVALPIRRRRHFPRVSDNLVDADLLSPQVRYGLDVRPLKLNGRGRKGVHHMTQGPGARSFVFGIFDMSFTTSRTRRA